MTIVEQREAASTVPRLLISLPLEGDAALTLDARSLEDEWALRGWLRRSGSLDRVVDVLVCLLDDMDACDEERAA